MDVRDQLLRSLGDAWSIERELGGGGISRVFVAHDESLGRSVAVKVHSLDLAPPLARDRFFREIRSVAALQDAHIVPLLAAGTTESGLPWYTMPLVRGKLRRAVIERGTVPVEQSLDYRRDVALALAHAHAKGRVHRAHQA